MRVWKANRIEVIACEMTVAGRLCLAVDVLSLGCHAIRTGRAIAYHAQFDKGQVYC